MSDQISFCEKLGVKAAKIDKVDGEDLLAQKLFLNSSKTMKDLRDHIIGIAIDESHCV